MSIISRSTRCGAAHRTSSGPGTLMPLIGLLVLGGLVTGVPLTTLHAAPAVRSPAPKTTAPKSTVRATVAPLDRTRALVAAFLSVAHPPDGKSLTADQRQANAKVFSQLDGFFDQAALKTQPIAPHLAKLSKAQAVAFGGAFYPLLRLHVL